MIYFCTKSGVRIVAPGVARSAGGDVEEYVEPAAATVSSRRRVAPPPTTAPADAVAPPTTNTTPISSEG